MQIDASLQILIAELGQRVGLGSLALGADGTCTLRFDKRTVIGVQYRTDEDSLWFYADLGVPASGPELYEDLLRGNLFWRTTFGATLSLSEDQPPRVIIALPARWRGLDGAQLGAKIEQFVRTVEDWSELVAERGDEGEEEKAPQAIDELVILRA